MNKKFRLAKYFNIRAPKKVDPNIVASEKQKLNQLSYEDVAKFLVRRDVG